jgi:hypothetical protein
LVRDDCETVSVNESHNPEDPTQTPKLEGGVLAELPRTRPQRSSPRRAATRAATASKAKKPAVKPAAKKPAATRKRVAKPPAKAVDPPAPKQGYEPEEEVELGNTINPPSGVELVESVGDIFGELASSGLAAGGRILKDAFSLLRRP